VIDGTLVASDIPLQGISRQGRRERQAVIDSGFDFCPLLIVIPGDELQIGELFA
jgi:hypothetical protein